jgi:protein-disulfide isomerase
MSNRQARREQSRTSKPATRATRPTRPGPGGPPKKSGNGPDIFSRPYLIAVSVIIVLLAVILGYAASRGGSSSGDDLTKNLEAASAALPADMANGTKLGSDSAPIKLTEYEDFQCPFCLQYTANQEPTIVSEYVKTGKVQIIYNNLPLLGQESIQAAYGGLCAADQNKFWQFHDQLFLIQAKADQVGNEKRDVGRFTPDKLKQVATDVGIDRSKFDSCLDNAASEKLSILTDQQRAASGFGIQGTPGFLLNGQPFGNGGAPSTVAGWRTLLDSVLASPTPGASASPAGTASAAAGTAAASTTPAATTAASATSAASASPAR